MEVCESLLPPEQESQENQNTLHHLPGPGLRIDGESFCRMLTVEATLS